ncbi:MAG: serine/threonine-protein kinase, partial [Planctomycetota bacterium]
MTLVERYEQWFQEGKRPLGEFLNEIECDGSELRELILTDQHLRHEAGLSYSPIQYASLGDVDTDGEFQLELWLEALGYAEEDGVSTETFLAQIPDAFREDVRSKCIGAAASPHPIVRPPTMARYRIDRELGRGAFGVVYEAWDHQLDRAVAVKVLRAGTREKETDFAEARLVAGLDHPGLVSVYDCGHDQHGQAFLVTQLVEGRSLSDWAEMLDASREVERRRICELFSRLCDALAAAHQRGVVHRDLKPGNVLVRDQDQPVVLDFGLALSDWRPGREGEWVGTPAYMSPEQARGEGHLVDPRSDLFAVGILLFEALTGERPWRSESTQALLREIAHGSVRSLRQLKLEIPVELESICRKATAASMPDRYASAKE